MNNFVRHKVGALKDPGVTHGYRLPDEPHLSQSPLVGVLLGEGELPVGEAAEVVLGVVDELLGRLAILPETRL